MELNERIQTVLGPKLRFDIPLATYSTFKIGGPAKYFITIETSDELVDTLIKARNLQLKTFILGGGTNILIGDNGFDGLVVKNGARKFNLYAIKGNSGTSGGNHVYIKAESGVIFNQLVRYSIEQGLRGLEMQLGLPGTAGGAVTMNAKWMHPPGFVGDVVYQATILTPQNEIKIVPQSYFQFSYGSSAIPAKGDILIDIIFRLTQSNSEHLWAIANASIAYRRKSQPQGVFSAGCIFKNISAAESLIHRTPNGTTSAGYLIDHSGLAGKESNDAIFSKDHANFIINRGKAKARDVIELIQLSKDKVKNQFGVELKEEIIRVGDF